MRKHFKICTAAEAVAHIPSDVTIVTGGFVGAAHPEALTAALEQRFLETGHPRNLTLTYAAGQGDGQSRGLNHLAHAGLIHRVVGSHWSLAPKLGKLAIEGKIQAYNFPQGVMCQIFRDIAAGRPGCITHIGLDTFADPIHDAGTLNDITPRELVDRIELGGKTWLWYKSFPIHVGLIRATAADSFGNLIMDEEVYVGEVLPIAQAVHNHGGIVIAQVQRILDEPVPPHRVRVPGIMVDYVVVSQGSEHDQTFCETHNPGYYTAGGKGEDPWAKLQRLPLDERKIIASRACDEVPPNAIANLGIGMPEGIARVAAQRGWLNRFTLTIESGPIGGMPAGGLSFGASLHPQAIVDQPSQFDFYDGKALDFAALGAAQIDAEGNVNVSRFGSKLAGIGGFANITQTARKLVFCGTFTTGGLEISIENKQLKIVNEGKHTKFVKNIEHRSFSAKRARELGQEVWYITERAVFKLGEKGLELVELAPGIDLQSQVLSLMAFEPVMTNVTPMPAHVFED